MKFGSEVLDAKDLTHDTKQLRLSVPDDFKFEPGQFIMLFIAVNEKLEKRPYTIAFYEKGSITLCVKKVDGGLVSPNVHELKKGDRITLQGPFTGFRLRNKDSVFIAVGVGIAPFVSMISSLLQQGKKAILLAGYKHENEILYDGHFKKLAAENQNFKYHVAVTRDESYKGEKGRVDVLVEKYVPNGFKGNFYICGMAKMMKDVKELLIKKGIDEKRINP